MAASRGSGAGGLLSTIIYTISSIAAMPWTLFLRWLSWCAALGLQGLAILGAPPTGYIPADKVRDLQPLTSLTLLLEYHTPNRRLRQSKRQEL